MEKQTTRWQLLEKLEGSVVGVTREDVRFIEAEIHGVRPRIRERPECGHIVRQLYEDGDVVIAFVDDPLRLG